MNYKVTIGVCLAGLVLSGTNVTASESLRHNPFEQPENLLNRPGALVNDAISSALKLHGTVLDGESSLANIDGKLYRVQQEVAGYRVIQINSGSVTLRRGDIDMVLTLKNDN